MNTLDKILNIEAKTNSNEKSVAMLEGALRDIVAETGRALNAVVQKQDLVVNKIMAIEQSLASLAKTVTAMAMELEESGHLSSDKVYERMRLFDENEEKTRVSKMIGAGAIKKVDLVGENSILVVSQKVKLPDESIKNIADYRVYELTSPFNDKKTIELFVGKVTGDVVEITSENGLLSTTILEVYEHQRMASDMTEMASTEGKVDESSAGQS